MTSTKDRIGSVQTGNGKRLLAAGKVGEVGMNDIEEAISYIESTKKHLLHLGEIWYADYLDDAIALLKEHGNNKLIDADKLREKLGFAERCEYCKRDPWKCGCETIYSLQDFCIAIEELMQGKAVKWE